MTLETAKRLAKPVLHLDLGAVALEVAGRHLARWLGDRQPHILNVAGPRSSEDSRLYDDTRSVLSVALRAVKARQ